jgi:hypothetical protein
MKKKYRIPKNPELLAKNVLEYYYNNPKANSLKEMQEIFDVAHTRITKIISDDLKARLENSLTRRMINKF